MIEDVAFVNCRLTDCDLYYSGGDFDWMNSHFESCRFHWRRPREKHARTLPEYRDDFCADCATATEPGFDGPEAKLALCIANRGTYNCQGRCCKGADL